MRLKPADMVFPFALKENGVRAFEQLKVQLTCVNVPKGVKSPADEPKLTETSGRLEVLTLAVESGDENAISNSASEKLAVMVKS